MQGLRVGDEACAGTTARSGVAILCGGIWQMAEQRVRQREAWVTLGDCLESGPSTVPLESALFTIVHC